MNKELEIVKQNKKVINSILFGILLYKYKSYFNKEILLTSEYFFQKKEEIRIGISEHFYFYKSTFLLSWFYFCLAIVIIEFFKSLKMYDFSLP